MIQQDVILEVKRTQNKVIGLFFFYIYSFVFVLKGDKHSLSQNYKNSSHSGKFISYENFENLIISSLIRTIKLWFSKFCVLRGKIGFNHNKNCIHQHSQKRASVCVKCLLNYPTKPTRKSLPWSLFGLFKIWEWALTKLPWLGIMGMGSFLTGLKKNFFFRHLSTVPIMLC